MTNLATQLKEVNHHRQLWQKGEIIVVGVSGGPDSVCLLDLLVNIAAKDNLSLIVAHVNHGVRGEKSDHDEKFVADLAKTYDLPCETFRVEQSKEQQNENAWREARYDFFEKVRAKHDAHKIAVAHTKNDQAETVLLRMLRGAGLQGLSAMKFQRDAIIRPLLGVSRDEILAYCDENNITFCTDETNADTTFLRNRVRHELLPLLSKNYNKNIVDTLATAAEHIADDYNLLEESIDVTFEKKNDTTLAFSRETYCALHPAAQRMVLKKAITELSGATDVEMSAGNFAEMHKAIISTKGKNQEVQFGDLKMSVIGDSITLTTN